MKVLACAGREDIALVYIAETKRGKLIEFVESLQPPLPREEKWVIIVSSLYGCPVGCSFCDAGGDYQGKLSFDDIISQIDYLVKKRFPDGKIPVKKFKIQFARMGEPAFNPNVLSVLGSLPRLYSAPGLLPTISTIAPKRTERFFECLREIKEKYYPQKFQLQFSIHTTDEKARDSLIPYPKWDFKEIAEYGRAFYGKGGRKITLNFALAFGYPVDAGILLRYFSPEVFLIKITPVNPTYAVIRNKINPIPPDCLNNRTVDSLRAAGYEVILAIGELEENRIGSNCGQFINRLREKSAGAVPGGYTYPLLFKE